MSVVRFQDSSCTNACVLFECNGATWHLACGAQNTPKEIRLHNWVVMSVSWNHDLVTEVNQQNWLQAVSCRNYFLFVRWKEAWVASELATATAQTMGAILRFTSLRSQAGTSRPRFLEPSDRKCRHYIQEKVDISTAGISETHQVTPKQSRWMNSATGKMSKTFDIGV